MMKMKYVLLAFGVLLAICGCLVLAASYGTMLDGNMGSLIGAIGLSAGILIVGQALVLRSLESLRTSLERSLDARLVSPPVTDKQFVPLPNDPYGHAAHPAEPAFADNAPAASEEQFAYRQHQEPVIPSGLAPPLAAPSSPSFEAKNPNGAKNPNSEGVPSEGAPTFGGANVDTDLLEAALASPSEAEPKAPVGPLVPELNMPSPPDLSSNGAPRTSPSLSDMWRRVAARTTKPPRDSVPLAPSPLTAPETSTGSIPAMAAGEPADLGNSKAEASAASDRRKEEPKLFQLVPSQKKPAEGLPVDAASESHTLETHDAELGDWFDRALSGLDEHLSPQPSEAIGPKLRETGGIGRSDKKTAQTSVLPQPIQADSLAGGPLSHKPTGPETAKERDSHASAELESRSVAEIGRYEADGTTYVMYSDGSIEAQSEQGAYRFASMAELKAFFDEQAVAT
jgi:hypothetical protein